MVVDFEEALEIVARHSGPWSQPPAQSVPLLESLGRVLAQDICADRDQPPFDRATRDGFAVQAAALSTGGPLRVTGQVRAGQIWAGDPVHAESALSIMTGAPLPNGADAVVMIEHVVRTEDGIMLSDGKHLAAGENFVPRGSEARAGDVVIPSGARLGAAEIALAANCGCVSLQVARRPQVAIVSTGDELVELSESPGNQQIRNSNSYALAALVSLAGGRPDRLPIAPDTLPAISATIEEARTSDLIVLTGGVSMGEYDLVEEVLTSLGAEFFFTGVRMQPGKPAVFGRLPASGSKPPQFFFGLPGNPISAQVTFHCFVEPLLRALGGESAPQPRWAQATLGESVKAKPGLTRLLPARSAGIEVWLVGWQGSGDLAANSRANCYAELLPGRPYAAGEVIRILLR